MNLTLAIDLDSEDMHSMRTLLEVAENHMLDIYKEEGVKPGDHSTGLSFYGNSVESSSGAFRLVQKLRQHL